MPARGQRTGTYHDQQSRYCQSRRSLLPLLTPLDRTAFDPVRSWPDLPSPPPRGRIVQCIAQWRRRAGGDSMNEHLVHHDPNQADLTDEDLAVDLSVAPLTRDQALAITTKIQFASAVLWDLLVTAYHGRAWSALGYPSWDAYCSSEFKNTRIRLPREERAEVVCSLRESGLSIRAIASGVGIDTKTVQTDLKSGVGNSHTSLAGRCEHCKVNPPRAGDAVCEACHRLMVQLGEREPEPIEVEAVPLDEKPTPIIGQDGKTYRRNPKPVEGRPEQEDRADHRDSVIR